MTLFMLGFALSHIILANEYKLPVPVLSDKLIIEGVSASDDDDGSVPHGWLRFYEFKIKMGHENVIPLSAKFDINNVQAIVITDVNASKNKCGFKQKRHLFYLYLPNPSINQHKITTRITKPCIINRKATIKLSVKTADNKYYYSLTTLTTSSYAFDAVFHMNYE